MGKKTNRTIMIELNLIGHLGKDAEVKEIGNNKVINFSVAISKKYKDRNGQWVESTTWVDVNKWGENTNVAPYLKQGTQVYVSGEPSARAYLGNDNQAKGVLSVNAFNIKLLGTANSQDNRPSKGKYKEQHKTPEKVQINPDTGDDLPF